MKKSVWIFLLAVFLPGAVLGWLALRGVEEQQIVFERRTAELYQKETDALAASVREAVEAERRSFGEAVHRLLARSDADALGRDFTNTLADVWPRKAIGFALNSDGSMLSPTTKAAVGNTELRDFIWNNGGWLCSTQPAVVYRVPIDNNNFNKFGNLASQTPTDRNRGAEYGRYAQNQKPSRELTREKEQAASGGGKGIDGESPKLAEVDAKPKLAVMEAAAAKDATLSTVQKGEARQAGALAPDTPVELWAEKSLNEKIESKLRGDTMLAAAKGKPEPAVIVTKPEGKPVAQKEDAPASEFAVEAQRRIELRMQPDSAEPLAKAKVADPNGALRDETKQTAQAPQAVRAPQSPQAPPTAESPVRFGSTMAKPGAANALVVVPEPPQKEAHRNFPEAMKPLPSEPPSTLQPAPLGRAAAPVAPKPLAPAAPTMQPAPVVQIAPVTQGVSVRAASKPAEAPARPMSSANSLTFSQAGLPGAAPSDPVAPPAAPLYIAPAPLAPSAATTETAPAPLSPALGWDWAGARRQDSLKSNDWVYRYDHYYAGDQDWDMNGSFGFEPSPTFNDWGAISLGEQANESRWMASGRLQDLKQYGENRKPEEGLRQLGVPVEDPALSKATTGTTFLGGQAQGVKGPKAMADISAGLDADVKKKEKEDEKKIEEDAVLKQPMPDGGVALQVDKAAPDKLSRVTVAGKAVAIQVERSRGFRSKANENEGLQAIDSLQEQTSLADGVVANGAGAKASAPAPVAAPAPAPAPAPVPVTASFQASGSATAGEARPDTQLYYNTTNTTANSSPRNVAPLQVINAPSQAVSTLIPDTAEFRMITAMSDEGMVSRFVQDKLDLIFWVRPPEAPEMVFGCLVEVGSLLELWPSLLGRTNGDNGRGQPPFVLALLDDKAKPMAIHPTETGTREWKRPFVASEIGEALPHWEAALYLATPGALAESARGVRRTLSFTVAAALALIIIGAWLVVADIRRQLALAQQKTDFVSNVSHELKTPLTSIRMFAELMHDRPPPVEKQGQYLRIITVEAERLTRLINNVLDFAKLERRQKRFDKRPLDLHCVITRVWEGHEMHLRDAGFTTRWQAAPPPYPVVGDEDALSQILVNMLSNAEKYSPERKEVELHTWTNDGWLHISVLDRGMGVPEGEERKIFESFYRAHDSLSSGIQGSGLGLTLAQRLAEEHGGKIEFARREGGGSRFTLRLPLVKGDRCQDSGMRGQDGAFPSDLTPPSV